MARRAHRQRGRASITTTRNSGDYARDATLPGRPFGKFHTRNVIIFKAPGDDLLCGTAERYKIVTSDRPINPLNFNQAQSLGGAPAPEEAGSRQTYTIPAAAKRYVAIRAVDDQGNVGRPVTIDLGPTP